MKNRLKGIIAGCIVLVLLFGVYFFAMKWSPESEISKENITYETNYLFKSTTDSIESIEFNYDGNSYTIHNGEKKTISGYKSNVIDSDSLTRVLHSFSSIIENQNIEVTETNLSEYGINDSKTYVVIKENDGNSTKLVLGISAFVDGEYYAYNENSGRLSSISGTVAELFTADPSQYRSLKVCDIANNTIKHISISKGNKKIIEVEYDEEKGLNADKSPNFKMNYPYKGVAASTDRITALLEPIGNIVANSIVTENMSEISMYGLDNPYILKLISEDESHTIKIGDKNQDGLVYIMYNDRNVVYLADCPFYEKVINVNTYDYIDRFIHLVYLNDVNTIEFSSKNTNAVLKIEGDTSKDNAKYYVNDEIVGTSEFKELYQAIIGVTAAAIDDNFTPQGKEQCTITFNLKDNKKKTFKYYIYDERNYYVKADSGIGCIALKKNIDAICELLK